MTPLVITTAQLAALHCASPAVWAPLLSRTIADNAIRNPVDWLANMLHESNRFGTLRESLNYDVAGLLDEWPSRFSPVLAAGLGRIGPAGAPARAADQWWIAEHAYGGRMGNRPAGSGDGWNFRGAGPLQNTGHDNLMAFANGIGWAGHLEDLADKLATPEFGAPAAGQFWRAQGCDALTDPKAIRIRVNGGTNGLAEVVALRIEVARALSIPTGRAPPVPLRAGPPTPRSDPDNSADDLNALQLARNT